MPDSETKICQNCKASFEIDASDFVFYDKIKVPAPTWCPECRTIRRMVFRDGIILYKRKCDFSNKEIFSVFKSDTSFKVYERDLWWSDKWDAINYGKDYDWNKPFFEQFKELLLEVPKPSRTAYNLVNSDYSQGCADMKDSYLVFMSTKSENCAYGCLINNVKDSYDLTQSDSSELCYNSLMLKNCYKTFFSIQCDNCVDVYFSRNLINCNKCFGCINLRNKQYHIFNKPYSKDDYENFIKELNIGSYSSILKLQEDASRVFLAAIFKFANNLRNSNVSGEYINNSKNVFNGYYVINAEDCKNVQLLFTPSSRDCHDLTLWGQNAELVYDSCAIGDHSYNIKFSYRCYINDRDIQYSAFCHSSNNLFGCVGLRKKQYCILNKQYTKEEYEKLMPKIIDHMNSMPYVSRINADLTQTSTEIDTDSPRKSVSSPRKSAIVYKYGEFFPPELSPFCYNETIAQEYFPLTKEQAAEQGYKWKDPEPRNYQIDYKTEDLPDHIKDVPDSIVNKIIQCAHHNSKNIRESCNEQCTEAFKIIEPELDFYRKMNLPLPRLCPNCRHYQRIKQRNPLKLWHRKCQCAGTHSRTNVDLTPTNTESQRNSASSQRESAIYKNTIQHFHGSEPCPDEFETSYAPERPEIVYCEKCYQAEVV